MADKTPLEQRAEWRERQARGLEEGDARLRQLQHRLTPRPRLPGGAVMSLEERGRAHRDPETIAPVHEPFQG